MAGRLTVVVSQGQSANPLKRKLEEDLVGRLLGEPGIELTVVPHLYDLAPNGTGMLCLQGIAGDLLVLSWLYPRAAHWTLDRHGICGRVGRTLLVGEEEDEEPQDDAAAEGPTQAADHSRDEAAATQQDCTTASDDADGASHAARTIWCLDLRLHESAEPYVEEIRRIVRESQVETVGLMGWIGGSPRPEALDRYLDPSRNGGNNGDSGVAGGSGSNGDSSNNVGHGTVTAPLAAQPGEPANGGDGALPIVALGPQPQRIDEATQRRWYPVIDFSRCTNCMECLDFCLFGVYGVDRAEQILVEQPDNCRKGCPACSRVCPENAIIFPQHKTPTIAGSNVVASEGFKIDLSKLFGEPNSLDLAVEERDRELVAAGRDAVGTSVGLPRRQLDRTSEPKDDLDNLIDRLDELDL